MIKNKLYKKVGKKYIEVPSYLDVDSNIILFCAFRYALGRMTYVVSSVIDAIYSAAATMHKVDKDKYVAEINEHLQEYGKIGMDFDTKDWLKLAAFLDESNRHKIEANKHNTDEWVEVEAFFYDGKYYDPISRNEYHTTREIKGR